MRRAALPALAALLLHRRAPSPCWCPTCRSADRDRLQLHRRRAAAVRRDPLSRRARARATPPTSWSCVQGPDPVDPGAREAEGRRHLGQRRQRALSLGAELSTRSPRRGRSAQLVDERTAAIYELGLDSLQLSPASGAPADEQERFERGLVDLKAARRPLCRGAGRGVEISDGVLYRARIADPRARAGRPLHRRDLPDPRRPRGGRRRCARSRSANRGSSASSPMRPSAGRSPTAWSRWRCRW